VADSGNHRVLEFDERLGLVRQFGSGEAGDADGQLRGPMDVAVDEERGLVVIADSQNNRIVVYSPSGQFLRSFGRKGDGPGEMSFIRMPVMILLLANVVAPENIAADTPPPAPMPAEDVERYYREPFKETQRFYWANSSMRYWIDFDLYVDEAMYRKGEPPEGAPPWYTDLPQVVAARSIKKVIEAAGEEKLYCGRVTCEAVRRWAPATKTWSYQGSGGGARGIDNWPQPGATQFLGGSDVAWLFTHEFKHQVESQYTTSGLVREDDRNWFCHFSPKHDDPNTDKIEWQWDTAADHGEHWDGIAWQMRHMTRDQYMRNCWGELLTAADRDGDGIPDRAPELPLDEHRLGSSPDRADTDGDGVGDMQEVLASTWVTAMNTPIRQRAAVPYIHPGLTRADSDGDGVPDRRDPYPIYPYKPEIPRASVTVDGDASDWEKCQVITFRRRDLGPAGEDVDITVRAAWDGDWLQYCLEVNSPHAGISLVTDNDADGYYVGNDNLYVQIAPDGALASVRMHLCNDNRWPHFDNEHEVLEPEELRYASRTDDERQTIEMALPKRPDIGLNLRPGERIGLMVYVRLPSHSLVSVFEPYSIFDSVLIR
ncbi:MAG: hypothetical protein ACE5JM_14500, partial [Armatimonadota bacterium]